MGKGTKKWKVVQKQRNQMKVEMDRQRWSEEEE